MKVNPASQCETYVEFETSDGCVPSITLTPHWNSALPSVDWLNDIASWGKAIVCVSK